MKQILGAHLTATNGYRTKNKPSKTRLIEDKKNNPQNSTYNRQNREKAFIAGAVNRPKAKDQPLRVVVKEHIEMDPLAHCDSECRFQLRTNG